MNEQLRPRVIALTAAAALVAGCVAGCATQGDLPSSNLAVARTSISQAESADAPRLAPIEYQNAREKLVRADEAVRARRYDDARRLADEASADADVAARKARAVKAATAAAELQRSNSVLSSEVNRTTQTTTTVVVPAAGAAEVSRQTTTVVTQPASRP